MSLIEPNTRPRLQQTTGGPCSDAGIYIHFPFCVQKCPYCDFASRQASPSAIPQQSYTDAAIRELSARAEQLAAAVQFTSVFVGGGTPSLWEPAQLGRLLQALQSSLALDLDQAEVSLECNPCSFDDDRAARYRDVGVNRFSIGVQSLDDSRLRFLGRLHDASGALRAVRCAVRSGARLSADLIHGLPAELPSQAAAEAQALIDEGVEHLSAYLLTVERRTVLGLKVARGEVQMPADEVAVESFFAVSEAALERGMQHYEVSNFARPGAWCRHNLSVWRGQPYLGLGAGAVGTVPLANGQLVRTSNSAVVARYLQADFRWPQDLSDAPAQGMELEVLGPEVRAEELMMLGLRLAEGVDLQALEDGLGVALCTAGRDRRINRLVQRGRLWRDGWRIGIPRRAWIWENDTVASLV